MGGEKPVLAMKDAVRRPRRAWSDASVLVKGLRVVALPVLALVLTSGLVLAADAQRGRAQDQRQAAEAIAERTAEVQAISAKAAAVAEAGRADAATLERMMAFRGEWDVALGRVESAALAEPDEAMQADVRELRAATMEIIASTTAAFAPHADAAAATLAGLRVSEANDRFVAAMDSISDRATDRARAYADEYDRDSAAMSTLILVSAIVSAVGAIVAMVAFAVSIRRRVRALEANSDALGEGRPLVALHGGADELGRLGTGLDRAAALLRDREQALHDTAETLRQSEQRLALAIEAGEMGTWDVDLPTGVCVWDAQSEVQHGLAQGTFGGTFDAWLDTVHPDDRAGVMSDGAEAIAAGGRWATEYRLAADAERWIGTCGLSFLDDGRMPVRLVGVSTDITGRKVGEQRLRQAIEAAEQANHAKNDFLSRVSHELRTPLNAILGFSQLLEMDDLTESQRESVAQVLSGGRHLLGLIDDVLDISRIESGNLPVSIESTAVGEVVAETVSMVSAMAFDLGVVVEVAGSAGESDLHVCADRRRLKQILVNLASNAVKYNRRDGLVTFAVSTPADGVVRISVRDTGPGIPADKLGRLFTPFDRLGAENTPVDGTGIGLALSQRLAETMDATLSVESEVGGGSVFSIDVPLAEDPSVAAGVDGGAATLADTTQDAPGGTVLYVEDNPSNLRLVQRIVDRRGGIRLLSAGTGSMALSLAARIPVDVVLLDLHLPDMNGAEVLRQLRERPETRHTPVVVVSADATPGQIERLRDVGADAFLSKPFDVGTFLGVLDDYLAVLA